VADRARVGKPLEKSDQKLLKRGIFILWGMLNWQVYPIGRGKRWGLSTRGEGKLQSGTEDREVACPHWGLQTGEGIGKGGSLTRREVGTTQIILQHNRKGRRLGIKGYPGRV